MLVVLVDILVTEVLVDHQQVVGSRGAMVLEAVAAVAAEEATLTVAAVAVALEFWVKVLTEQAVTHQQTMGVA